jgi:Alpha/beta hydrolase domain
VPLATYTGWALRSGPQANDGCESTGQYIPFAKTAADRVTANGTDPRPSVAERYSSFESYYGAVVNAINDMTSNRLLLCEDVAAELDRLTTAGLNAGVPPKQAPAPGSRRSTALALPSCLMGGQ